MVVAKAHNMLLNCGIAADADLAARCRPATRGAGPGPRQDPHRPGGQRGADHRRVTTARAISTPPAKLLDQYIESAIACLRVEDGPGDDQPEAEQPAAGLQAGEPARASQGEGARRSHR